ncbi:MAG: response regulator transcription factor [Chloroflexi bacterium]|nr:MAG: response regulator transcription factor [Chloroflexota bacterium]
MAVRRPAGGKLDRAGQPAPARRGDQGSGRRRQGRGCRGRFRGRTARGGRDLPGARPPASGPADRSLFLLHERPHALASRGAVGSVGWALLRLAHGQTSVHLQLRRGAATSPASLRSSPGPDAEGVRLGTTDASVLSKLAQGLSDREIASRLHRSPHTIKHYVERLREAVGARNRIELAAWAGRHGFDQPSSSSVADVLA